MKKINIAICEDDLEIIKRIEGIIMNYYSNTKTIATIYSYRDGHDFLNDCATVDFFVIFMDIDLGTTNGLEVVANYRKVFKGISNIVFVTSYAEYKSHVLPLHTFDYLVKPFSKTDIINILDELSLWSKKEKKEDTIWVSLKTVEGLITLDIDKILYFESFDRRIKIKTFTKEYFMYTSIKALASEYEKNNFYSPHSAYLVNLKNIEKIGKQRQIVMSDDSEVPLSQSKSSDFKEKYFDFRENV